MDVSRGGPPLRLWMALALTFAAYIACVSAGYIWDDEALILLNQALVHPTFRTILGSDLWCCSGTAASGYWRPLTTLSFYADVAAFGFQPAWGHLHSLAWHLLCTTLVARLVGNRHGGERGAVAALIFGLHPILSEAVVWIAARNDLMATAFAVGALLAVDRRKPVLAAICALAAALSKESSFLLPALVVLWVGGHEGLAGVKARRGAIGATALGLGVALALRPLAELGRATDFHRVPIDDPFASLYTLARLIGWLGWPWPLTGTATLYLPPPGIAVWASALVVLAGAAFLVRAEPRRGLCLVAFTVLAALPMAVALWVFATIGERYMYLPMVGAAALVATALPLTRFTKAGLAIWAVGALAAIHVRLPDWVDNLAFYEAAVRRAPDSFSWNLYGGELERRQHTAAAVEAMERSLAARPVRRFSCTRIAGTARAVMDATTYKAHLPGWSAAGCRELPAFDFQVAWSLSLLGDEPGALGILLENPLDHSGVAAAIHANIATREGDIVLAAGLLDASADLPEAHSRYSTLRALRVAEGTAR